MALAIIQLISTALSLWNNAQKQKYLDENSQLEAAYHAEINKPIASDAASYAANPSSYRNDANIDNIEFQLCNLSLSLSTAVAGSNS